MLTGIAVALLIFGLLVWWGRNAAANKEENP
jgi:hypothetical protein